MNYFQFLAHPRQAVFCLTAVFIFSLSATIFAQDETEKNQNKNVAEVQKTNQPAAETDVLESASQPKLSDKPKFSREMLTVKDPFDLRKSENQKFRDFSFNSKTKSEAQQSPDDDDTMMGVMGKGTDSVKLGGHVGFVVPIVGRGNGVTTNLGDRFVFGFPVGLTVKTKKNVAIDFEFIPTFNTGRDFVLTIHPGIIYGFAKKYAVGVRAAYDAGAGSFGFTPLISRGFKINDKLGWFIEADFPIRSNYNPYRNRFGSIAFAAHAGIAF